MSDFPSKVWFPEPDAEDEQAANRDEHPLDWLARCTNWKGKECRRFLNESLSLLPSDAVQSFETNARPRWQSARFELIVARTLQELGATLKIEEANEAGKRPDFTASFADGSVIVEAVSPIFNAHAGETVKMQKPLLKIIEERLPTGIRCGVWDLPVIGLADSKKEFKAAIESIFSELPDYFDSDRYEIEKELSNGDIRITIFPGKSKSGRVGIEPVIAVFDNSEDRIRNAVLRKKSQVRDSKEPVLLAIDASGISSEFEDFDMALFGRTSERVDMNGKTVETGFDADGLFATRRENDPTYAGVIAFLEVGFQKCPNPVLYLHPRFSGSLPSAFQVLERRSLNLEANHTEARANSDDVMERLNFVKKPNDKPLRIEGEALQIEQEGINVSPKAEQVSSEGEKV